VQHHSCSTHPLDTGLQEGGVDDTYTGKGMKLMFYLRPPDARGLTPCPLVSLQCATRFRQILGGEVGPWEILSTPTHSIARFRHSVDLCAWCQVRLVGEDTSFMRYAAPSKDEMDAMPPEQAKFHNVSTPWWSQGGTSQGIADCGQCGYVFAIWPKTTDGVLAVVCV